MPPSFNLDQDATLRRLKSGFKSQWGHVNKIYKIDKDGNYRFLKVTSSGRVYWMTEEEIRNGANVSAYPLCSKDGEIIVVGPNKQLYPYSKIEYLLQGYTPRPVYDEDLKEDK